MCLFQLLELGNLDLPFLEIKGYKNRDPHTAWVEYKDKRTGTPFYYNPVSTKIQYCTHYNKLLYVL